MKVSPIIFVHIFFTLIIGLLFTTASYAEPPKDFSEAKKIARYLFREHPITLYCGCPYQKDSAIDWDACGYQPGRLRKRAKRMEWEHIVPAHAFGKNRSCWIGHCDKNAKCCKGRPCCQARDTDFNKMEADLHNLYPAIGEINAVRSNYQFKDLPNTPYRYYGKCLLKIDHKYRLIEPRPEAKGLIARAYLYMHQEYQVPLSSEERSQFERWSREHPADAWEKDWNQRVKVIQGNENTYIK